MQANRKIKNSFFIVFILFISSCAQKNFSSSEVNYISGNNSIITVRAKGKGINELEARENAEKNAINTLLFRGLPDSDIKHALIGTNESQLIEKNNIYFKIFFEDKRYKTFIMSSEIVADMGRVEKGLKGEVIDVKINVMALKEDLQVNRVIRKFGY